MQRLKLLQSKEILTGLRKSKFHGMQNICEACQIRKQEKRAIPHERNVTENMLDIVHFDGPGPAKAMSMGCIQGETY